MAYTCTHPVEIGAFGRFRYGGHRIVNDWLALEDLCVEYCGGMWIGIYSAWDIVQWARRIGLLNSDECAEWTKRLN